MSEALPNFAIRHLTFFITNSLCAPSQTSQLELRDNKSH